MSNILVIGAGLFGSTIARGLARDGHRVTVFDDRRPMGATAPSGLLMRPSWIKKLTKQVTEPALATLDEIYKLETLKFKTRPKLLTVSVFHIESRKVLTTDDLAFVEATVTEVHPHRVVVHDAKGIYEEFYGDVVIVAAGYWSDKLMEVPGLSGMQGISFRWKGGVDNIIAPWAPYKQSVVFQERDGEAWGGDGSKIKPENWKDTRPAEALARVARCLGQEPPQPKSMMGIRPFTKTKPCVLEEREPGLWLATGGAKNGCVASGWVTWRLREALG